MKQRGQIAQKARLFVKEIGLKSLMNSEIDQVKVGAMSIYSEDCDVVLFMFF